MEQTGASSAQSIFERTVRGRSVEWGRQVQTTGDSLRKIGEQLRTLGVADPAADLAESGADWAQRLGTYLQTADLDRLLHDAETFARRQPFAVVAGGLVLGIATARMLKVGSSRRYETYGDRASYESYESYGGLQ
ncbi:MAG: hypothetical protein JO359_04190 [Candidatus Eremiobacteraeota bacterium]|nr:hypothetical protein [Candidatus Eremiobacteraeota bacterium]